jgi:hypothetical protein
MFVIVEAPAVVDRKIVPPVVPTSRTSSFCGEIAIALILADSTPLTSIIEFPVSVER